MACPYLKEDSTKCEDVDKDTPNHTYSSYLKIQDLLDCSVQKTNVHDEHLFIIIHQVYELWFKQVLFEIDSIRELFSPRIEENDMLKANSRLMRIVKIFSILVDQISILDTMTPIDFSEFRGQLGSSSGFQSWQFRLIENKMGITDEKRIKYNQQGYRDIFGDEIQALLEKSEGEISLFQVIEAWLERTPILKTKNFDFWEEFTKACYQWLAEEMKEAETEVNPIKRESLIKACEKNRSNFETVLIEENYEQLLIKGENSFSWNAFKGALMISYFRDETLFHQPYQTLSLLMDLDTLVKKWRFSHVLLVQRQIGSKVGTGGSSGYFYLRSTVSDRYSVFRDIFQLSNYLLPFSYITQLKETFCTTNK